MKQDDSKNDLGIDSVDRMAIADRLLAWWDAGHDSFPWRETTDPYAIWISEVMLQQTQVTTVIPYFQEWMIRFPTIETLALAPLDAVLKAWEGLGYYSRARNLHQAARQVVEQFGGCLPSSREHLQQLSGVGRYTAGAITSIAFSKPTAVLDGNVIRVLSRVFDSALDVTRSAVKGQLWELAQSLVPESRPGDYNQALMELGRKVCKPAKPVCHVCPLGEFCRAKSRGTQLERPVRPPRKRIPHYNVTAAVIWKPGTNTTNPQRDLVLIAQRPIDDMLGGLWEFPGGKSKDGETLPDCLVREIQEELALAIQVGELLITIKHAYTHFSITLHAFNCRVIEGHPQAIEVADFAWVTLEQLSDYAFPVTDQKIIAALKGLDRVEW